MPLCSQVFFKKEHKNVTMYNSAVLLIDESILRICGVVLVKFNEVIKMQCSRYKQNV